MISVKPNLRVVQGIPSDSFINDLNLFLQIDDKLMKSIFTTLRLEPSEDISDELEKLSKTISYDSGELKRIFRVGNFIFKKLEERKINLEELRRDFEKLGLKKENVENVKALYEDFGKNYAVNYLKYNTIRSNLYSLSPKITKMSYELNMRVIESKVEEKSEIIGQIPTVRIELETEPKSKEVRNDPNVKKLTFNATIEDLEKIIEDLNKIKLKLASLSKT
ncbi:MAG: hypothetical protein KKA10_13345 [Euryarchaeota archaeon]|nr:hypothetical protein [Euryarchaeota archaeon]MCG2735099.1 hypothetical protein [Candidatus Methanoperedenaceae archaeon]